MHEHKNSESVTTVVDRVLVIAVSLLLILGIVMVASSSITVSGKMYGNPFHFLIRQLVFLTLAIAASKFVLTMPIATLRENSHHIFIISLLLLGIVLIPHVGRNVNGSTRWLGIGPLGLQVSEFAKLAIILFISGLLVRRNEEIRYAFIGFVKPMAILSLVAFLLILEPDFGATVVIYATCMSLMFLAGMRLRYFVVLVLVVGAAMALLAVASPYRMHRITSFLNPWQNQYGSGYQLTQSLIAFGNGGFWGVGLGNSVQKLFYLPEAYTDFLFAVLAEELGLVGVLVIFLLYITVFFRSMKIGRRAQGLGDHYAGYCAYGIGLWLIYQFFINVGVNVGLLPTKGLTLPLMSYGGSSLLIDCLAIAVLFRIDYETRLKKLGFAAATPYRSRT